MLTWAAGRFKEAATLAWANQGTLTTTQGPIYATTKNVL
jgi:hypothetical protein